MYRDLSQALKHVILRVMIDMIINLAKKTHITMYISSHFSGKMTSFQGKWFGFQKKQLQTFGNASRFRNFFLEEEPIIGIRSNPHSVVQKKHFGASQDPSIFKIFISPVRKKIMTVYTRSTNIAG